MKRALILVLVLSAACARGPTVGAMRADPSSSATISELIAQTRAARGLPALAQSSLELGYAELQARAMAQRGHIFHSTFPGAENVGSIVADPGWERRIHAAFMASPEHLFNLLTPSVCRRRSSGGRHIGRVRLGRRRVRSGRRARSQALAIVLANRAHDLRLSARAMRKAKVNR